MSLVYDPAPVRPGEGPALPPMLTSRGLRAGADPFQKAVAEAGTGRAGAGDVFWAPDEDVLRAAVVFEPEATLGEALAMLFAAGAALNDAVGALGPPETAVHHVWPDGIKVNGGWCGAWRAASDRDDVAAEPAWLVVGLALSMRLPAGVAPGEAPGVTALAEEGCGHIHPVRLIESWSRHLLSWVHRWETDGPRPLFDAWFARAEGAAKTVVFEHRGALRRGTFLGLSETGDMLLKTDEATESLPLAPILVAPRAWPPA